MSDRSPPPTKHAAIDRERTRSGKPFDQDTGYSGQEYHTDRDPLADPHPPTKRIAPSDGEFPPDVGKRASINRPTGEVHGSGAGAGGSAPGEDYDSDQDIVTSREPTGKP